MKLLKTIGAIGVVLLILSPILYIGIFIDIEWLKSLGIGVLLCSPVIVVGLGCIIIDNNK